MLEVSLLPNGMAQLVDSASGEVVRYSLFEGHTILAIWSGTDKPEYRTAVAEHFGGAERMPETFDGRPSGAIAGLIAERTLAH
jgi:hypothetical protein